mgnify:CR=1 FL=1
MAFEIWQLIEKRLTGTEIKFAYALIRTLNTAVERKAITDRRMFEFPTTREKKSHADRHYFCSMFFMSITMRNAE